MSYLEVADLLVYLTKILFRNRLINIRATLLMLHDFRLLAPKLHQIWKRFINVIFIRKSKRGTRGNATGNWFELSTVPYPSPINEVLVTKHIDFWQGGRFRRGMKLAREKTLDLGGRLLLYCHSNLKRFRSYEQDKPFEQSF